MNLNPLGLFVLLAVVLVVAAIIYFVVKKLDRSDKNNFITTEEAESFSAWQVIKIKDLDWENVFDLWKKSEGTNAGWISLARERGYKSWAEWRLKEYAYPFDCHNAKWGLYKIKDPGSVISEWFASPFRTWIDRHYEGDSTKTFAELAQKAGIRYNPKVKSLTNNYPAHTIIIALRLADGRIFVVEGSHRACALAMMAKENKAPSSLIFAIGESDLTELPIVGQNTISS